MTMETGIISGISVSHRCASLDDIEAASRESQPAAIERLLDAPEVREAFVLQTCNRAEAYVVTDAEAAGHEALTDYVADVPGEAFHILDHEDSLRHLMRVAAGLESLVLGEDQIIGQVRDAVADARAVDGVGPVLDDALMKALHVGERARTETPINEGVVSLGSAAVRLAGEQQDLADATALVVGAGEMGRLAAQALEGAAERILVANRTPERARQLVETVGVEGSAVGLEALPQAASEADVVISATGAPEPLFEEATLVEAGDTFVVDIAQPRDVAPAAAALSNVEVHDLDALRSVTDETLSQRRAAAGRVESMIDEEFGHLMAQYKRKRADQVIGAMYEGAERMKAREIRTALSKMEAAGELNEEQREAVESMADALVSQLLASPTRSLRDAAEQDDWSTIYTALRLFDPSAGVPEQIPDRVAEGDVPPSMLEQLAGEGD